MSWPPQIPLQDSRMLQENDFRRLLDDATQQLSQGNPQQAFQMVLILLSALNLPGEVAAAATRVRDSMAADPSRDVSSDLASLLGTLSLSTASNAATQQPLTIDPPAQALENLHLKPQGHSLDVDMAHPIDRMDAEIDNGQRLKNLSLAADGEASYICERCGSVISVARRAAHDANWCQAVQNEAMEDT